LKSPESSAKRTLSAGEIGDSWVIARAFFPADGRAQLDNAAS
jgi:hypothetical protein